MSNEPTSPNDLIVERRERGVVTLTFNDPERLNAMTRPMGEAFAERVAGLEADPTLRALVLTGAGRAFSAGGDLEMIAARSEEAREQPGLARRGVRDFMRSFYGLFLAVRRLPCPTIAAVNGHAIGAGLCVALACDMRLVASEARLGLNFTRLGLSPGMGATWTLPRLVGPALAAELLYSSRLLDGDEAARSGLANRALPGDEVLPGALALADEIGSCSGEAVRATKRALERSLESSLADQLGFEAEQQARLFEGDDVIEGIAATRERREPDFGRD
ncbi:MAG: enoyl-CoA hydratase/isomerase family protein [Deltaproteobacteria bacterium]|nr:enoyl-CoA hydratase/isomerase family protein [Deltaproteobacteria bacterium]